MIEMFVLAFLHGKLVATGVSPRHYKYDDDCSKAANELVHRPVKPGVMIQIRCRNPEYREA